MFWKGESSGQEQSWWGEVFFAVVFIGKDYPKLLESSDNKGRKERKCASLSTGFVPGSDLSFVLLKGRSPFWQKQYSSAPLTWFLASLDFWNTTVCLDRNKWKKVQRFVAVVLNLALRGLWTASILYSDKLYSGVFFRRGVHSLYDCGRDLAHPQKCRNHWAKYSCPKAPVLSHSIIDSEFRRPGRWKFWVVTPVVPTLPSPQPRRLCNMYLNFQGGFLLIHKGSIPQCWTALTFRNIFLVLS